MKSKNRIYLIGLPGTGKSHFGKVLAAETGLPFYDLDALIEDQESRKITEIFETSGEVNFRQIESNLLLSFSAKEKFILASGGGTPCFHNGIQIMNETGITVYLTQDRATLIERISKKSHRPLMQGDVENRIDELLKTRSQFYEQADITMADRDAKKLKDLIQNL